MASPPPFPDSAPNDTRADAGPGPELPPPTPRWVKVFGIVGLAVALLFVVLMLTRGPGGRHGPGRHLPSGDSRGQTTPHGGPP